jgi:hypothetical protein
MCDINYLALSSLYRNYMGEGPYSPKAKQIYNELRENLMRNMFKVR